MRDFHGQFLIYPGNRGHFFRTGLPQTGDGSELFEESLLPRPADPGAVIEDALLDAPFHEELVVAVREAVRLVADALEQSQGALVVGDYERIGFSGAKDFLALLREADDG